MAVAVFHHIGTQGEFTNTIEEVLGFDGDITFDGAYKCLWKYREALAERQPLLFVQGDTVGTKNVLTRDEIYKLRDIGFVLGWHGWSHRKLTELPDWQVIEELEPDIGIGNNFYAYPHGEFDDRVKRLVEKMGYISAYSTTQGNDDPYSLRREYV